MQLFIKAMADNSLLRVLAEPNLVAISGETATFLAGGEFPIPVPQGNQTVTIEFREFGVRLNFTPVVLANQRNPFVLEDAPRGQIVGDLYRHVFLSIIHYTAHKGGNLRPIGQLCNAGRAKLSFDFHRRRGYNLRAFSKLTHPPAMTAP